MSAVSKKRIVSGMRPTGPLHLGNLHGALANWKCMQDEHDCFFFVADWHALTSNYDATGPIKNYIFEMFLDWLSVGISPEKCVLFVQSSVKEHAELFLMLSMITPLPWLERNPTYKDQIEQLQNKDLSTFGFLGYPVLQAADIIMYKANGVPVGLDQAPHLELTREITRRFNYLYREIFPVPETIMTQTPKILGLDRRKMSKSYNNAIYLSDSPDEIRKKIQGMITDPQRVRRNDPGDPKICNVFTFHELYSEAYTVERVLSECPKAAIGCVECKKIMADNLIAALEPIRERRSQLAANPGAVTSIVEAGNSRARVVAEQTMREVREALNL